MKESVKFWIALRSITGMGNAALSRLVEAFGSPEEVFRRPEKDLARAGRISPELAKNIRSFRNWESIVREVESAGNAGMEILTPEDAFYPRALRNIHNYPAVLYARGSLLENEPCIAIVGSRRASAYGKQTTFSLSRDLVMSGLTVASGMARGIDTAAHRGALAGGGRTIAVLGSGLDVIYPPENEELFNEIASRGAVISEFPPGTRPLAQHFPSRNRIISGLSLGTVVVEAGEKSGSLITAGCALEQGREVFAVPGSIDSPVSRGAHYLLRQGAKLVEGAGDVLEEIFPQMTAPMQARLFAAGDELHSRAMKAETTEIRKSPDRRKLEGTERKVLELISEKPSEIDSIISKSGLRPPDVLSVLMHLELGGFIDQLPGKRFILKRRAL
ncbi:MAG: DNA-processing protein DprA [Syntrophales bacterium]